MTAGENNLDDKTLNLYKIYYFTLVGGYEGKRSKIVSERVILLSTHGQNTPHVLIFASNLWF